MEYTKAELDKMRNAAPAMYEALKQWQKFAESDYSGDGIDAVIMGKAAIKAAEGKE